MIEVKEYIEKYPTLIAPPEIEHPIDIADTYLYDIPEGWQNIFIQMCENIYSYLKENHLPEDSVVITYVKEKFGELDIFYATNFVNISTKQRDGITNIIYKAEYESSFTCVHCGKKAEYFSKGWILPYCEKCAKEQNEESNKRHKTNFSIEETFSKTGLH